MMPTDAKKLPTSENVSRIEKSFIRNTSGATAIEYALIASLLFLAIVGSIRAFATSTSDIYNEIDTTIDAQIN